MTDEPIGHAALRNLNGDEIRQLAAKLSEARGLPAGLPSAWPSQLDWGLSTEPTLSTASIAARVASLSHRWADTYLQEIGPLIQQLESDRRYYAEILSLLANETITQYELDEIEKIHDDEVTAGWYTFQRDAAAADLDGQNAWLSALTQANDLYTQLLSNPDVDKTLNDPNWVALLKATSVDLDALAIPRCPWTICAGRRSEEVCIYVRSKI